VAAVAEARRAVSPWNPANAVTASRFLTLPPFVWAVMHGYHQWATLFMLVCGLLDKADGLVARVFDCRSAFGELFDAITDALCYGFGLVIVAAYGWAPVVPVILVIALGVANIGMRVAYGMRAGRATNYKSYAMERLVAYTGYLIGLATSGFEVTYFFWVFPFVMVTILCYDAKRMLVDPVPS
jgi:phosphatidylglycerophosphate synthase